MHCIQLYLWQSFFFPMTRHSSMNPLMFSCVFLWLSFIQVLHELYLSTKECHQSMSPKHWIWFFKDGFPLNKATSSVMQSAIQLLDNIFKQKKNLCSCEWFSTVWNPHSFYPRLKGVCWRRLSTLKTNNLSSYASVTTKPYEFMQQHWYEIKIQCRAQWAIK